MSKLSDVFTRDDKRAQVVKDCLLLIDREVEDKSGLSGMAIRAGYAAVKGIRPGFVDKVVHDLLPEFADAVDPIYQEAIEKGRPVAQYFIDERTRVADSLLAITDGRARRTKSGVVKATYDRLRGSAKKNVEAAIPRLGELVQKHTS
jgi:hypothetical protein